jgi:hypothetical protein
MIRHTSTMKFTCAAKHLCGMPSQDMVQINHRCMNCMEPMHGALCGALFAEKSPSIKISCDVLSPNGKTLFNSPTAVICAICINHLDGASLKVPPLNEGDDNQAPGAASKAVLLRKDGSGGEDEVNPVDDHRPAYPWQYSDDECDFLDPSTRASRATTTSEAIVCDSDDDEGCPMIPRKNGYNSDSDDSNEDEYSPPLPRYNGYDSNHDDDSDDYLSEEDLSGDDIELIGVRPNSKCSAHSNDSVVNVDLSDDDVEVIGVRKSGKDLTNTNCKIKLEKTKVTGMR